MIRSKTVFLEVYNSNMEAIGQIHDIVSLQWSIGFRNIGTFQLTCLVDDLRLVAINNIYVLSDSQRMAYVTDVNVSRDINGIYTISVQGKDLIDVLNQRVASEYLYLYRYPVFAVMKSLFDSNIKSRGPEFLELDVDVFIRIFCKEVIVSRDPLYEIYMALMPEDYDVKVVHETNGQGQHIAVIYAYERDRDVTAHVFSDEIGNISAWNYHFNIDGYKNVAWVEGEGAGYNRKVAVFGNGYGMYRREIGIDARDISSEVEGGTLPEAEYMKALANRGDERLRDMPYIKEINVEVNNTDLDLSWIGDRVTVKTNEFEFNGFISQITEIYDSTGYSVFPTITIENIIYTLATEDYVDITTEEDDLLTT